MNDLPLDDEWEPVDKPPPVPVSIPAVRRGRMGPDDRWPVRDDRWYAYVDDRPIGYLDACGWSRRHSSFNWVPYTMSGGQLAGPWPLMSALDYLLRFDTAGSAPLHFCAVCGRRLRRRGDPDEHSALCPLVTGVLAR